MQTLEKKELTIQHRDHTGSRYREFILTEINYIEISLKGLWIGEQMKQLKGWLHHE